MSGISGFQPGASVYAQAWGIKNGVGEAPHIDVRDPATSDGATSWRSHREPQAWGTHKLYPSH